MASTLPKAVAKKFPYEFTTLKQRQDAVVMPDGYKPDKLLEYLLKNAETLYEPKKVHTSSDWLKTQTETGQTPKRFKQGGPTITWMSQNNRKIILFCLDGTIDEEMGQKLKLYCEAYFWTCEVEVVHPGGSIVCRPKVGKPIVKKTPKDFYGEHKITSRKNCGITQYNASEINEALTGYKNRDTFCILAVTNQDLYPKEEWNFVFGLANLSTGTGVFSFCRHQELFDDPETTMPEDEQDRRWFRKSAGTMVHEITHMFGIKHCIYYQCTMNGSNGSFETNRNGVTTLCPSCLAKLQMNIRFDSAERHTKLVEACKTLGFEAAKVYQAQLESI